MGSRTGWIVAAGVVIGVGLSGALVRAGESMAPEAPDAARPVATGADPAVVERMSAGAALGKLRDGGVLEDGEVGAVRAAIEAAHGSEPADARWDLGVALLAGRGGASDATLASAERAAEAFPDDADAQYALGMNLLGLIDEVSVFKKGARAKRALRCFERALEIDPGHLGARIGAIEYRLRAPGIAGGSEKRARALATTALEHDRSAWYGHLALGRLAADDRRWEEMDAQFVRATERAADDSIREGIMFEHAHRLMEEKGDAEAALAVSGPALAWGGHVARFAHARALRRLERYEEAIALYREVLEQNPDAENTSVELAECLRRVGRGREAEAQYERFLSEHPESDRAAEAREALDGLRRQAGRPVR